MRVRCTCSTQMRLSMSKEPFRDSISDCQEPMLLASTAMAAISEAGVVDSVQTLPLHSSEH